MLNAHVTPHPSAGVLGLSELAISSSLLNTTLADPPDHESSNNWLCRGTSRASPFSDANPSQRFLSLRASSTSRRANQTSSPIQLDIHSSAPRIAYWVVHGPLLSALTRHGSFTPGLFNRTTGDSAGNDLRESHAPLAILVLHILETQLPPTALPNDHRVIIRSLENTPRSTRAPLSPLRPDSSVPIRLILDEHLLTPRWLLHRLYGGTKSVMNRIEPAGLEKI